MDHIEQIQRVVPDVLSRKILDVGSGRGPFLASVKKRGGKAVGLEPYEKYVDMTKGEFEVFQGTGEKMPFPDSSFGFLNVSEVTEHCDDPEKLLKEIRRVLSHEGAAYISFTNRFAVKDPHLHLWFVNWLPRSMCERYVSLFKVNRDYSLAAGRQRLSEMHYYTYWGAKRAVKKAGLRPLDARLTKIPRIVWPIYFLSVPFFVSSHHIYAFKE